MYIMYCVYGVDFKVGHDADRPDTQSGKATSKFYKIWKYDVIEF